MAAGFRRVTPSSCRGNPPFSGDTWRHHQFPVTSWPTIVRYLAAQEPGSKTLTSARTSPSSWAVQRPPIYSAVVLSTEETIGYDKKSQWIISDKLISFWEANGKNWTNYDHHQLTNGHLTRTNNCEHSLNNKPLSPNTHVKSIMKGKKETSLFETNGTCSAYKC